MYIHGTTKDFPSRAYRVNDPGVRSLARWTNENEFRKEQQQQKLRSVPLIDIMRSDEEKKYD